MNRHARHREEKLARLARKDARVQEATGELRKAHSALQAAKSGPEREAYKKDVQHRGEQLMAATRRAIQEGVRTR